MKVLLICVLFLFAVGCDPETESKTFLTQPPYKNLTDSIGQQPQQASLYYKRGALLYQNEQLEAAKQDLKTAWQLQPTEEHALSLVTVLIKQHPDSAIQFIQQALQELPKSISLQMGLARGFQQKRAYVKALEVCEQVLVIYPNSVDALLLKSEILKQQNKDSESLATLEKAYSYAPFDAELSYNLAFAYAEAKNSKLLPLTDSLIQADSTGKQAQPYYFQGVYYANTGHAARAIASFNQAIAHDYTFLDAYMDKGALLYDQKKYTQALEVFQLAIRVTPTYAEGYYWVAKCQEALGKKKDAKLNYQRAYGLDKEFKEAKDAADRL